MGYKIYSPLTSVLIKEAFAKDANLSSANISKYVCEKQKRKKFIQLSGTLIGKAKKEMGIKGSGMPSKRIDGKLFEVIYTIGVI